MGRRKKSPIVYNGVTLQDFETPPNFWRTQLLSTQELYAGGYIKEGESFVPKPKRKRRLSDSAEEDESRTGLSQSLTNATLQEKGAVSLSNFSKQHMESTFNEILNAAKRKVEKERNKSPKAFGSSNEEATNYLLLGAPGPILRGKVNQSSVSGGHGVECATVAATVAAQSLFKNLNDWSFHDLDDAVRSGVRYYYDKFPVGHGFLEAYEVEGQLRCKNGKTVSIQVDDNDNGLFHGLMDNHSGDENGQANRMNTSVNEFIQSEYKFALLTANSNTFLLAKEGDAVFFADSHCRGPQGQQTSFGVACIIKFDVVTAGEKIKNHVQDLCQPRRKFYGNQLNRPEYSYSLQPFTCKVVGESGESMKEMVVETHAKEFNDSDSEDEVQMVRRKRKVVKCLSDSESDCEPGKISEEETGKVETIDLVSSDDETDFEEWKPNDIKEKGADLEMDNDDSETDFEPEIEISEELQMNNELWKLQQYGEDSITEERYYCSKCVFNTIDKDRFDKHVSTHRDLTIFKCVKKCKFTASTHAEVQKHAREAHNGLRLVPCYECGFKLFEPKKLRRHHFHYHTGTRECMFCSAKVVQGRETLAAHINRCHRREVALHEPSVKLEQSPKQLLIERLQEVVELPPSLPPHWQLIKKTQFVVVYDINELKPVLVFEELTPEMIAAAKKMKRRKIVEDPDLPDLQVTPEAINYLGYDCGHLGAAGNHTNSETAFEETHLMSNIAPMKRRVNLGSWKAIENLVRKLAKMWSSVRIISGPIYDYATKPPILTTGCVKLPIPTHFFKLVFMERAGEDDLMQAYLVENKKVESNDSMYCSRVSIEEIERLSGLRFVGSSGRKMSWEFKTEHLCNIPTCRKVFLNAALLEEHNKLEHSEEHRCNLCQHTFESKVLLQEHVKLHVQKCPHVGCPFATTNITNLGKHMKQHDNERKREFKCEFSGCDKAFFTASDLKIHVMIHTGERPYKCDRPGCVKAFKTKGFLNWHKKRHAGEKPYKCNFTGCTKAFVSLDDLKLHQKRIHTGEKPYKCNKCPKRYAVRKDLNRHIKTHLRRKN